MLCTSVFATQWKVWVRVKHEWTQRIGWHVWKPVKQSADILRIRNRDDTSDTTCAEKINSKGKVGWRGWISRAIQKCKQRTNLITA
mmetsp:Transcript_59245/g.80942  ORF Transcript_59245/g.80942 Transcript_59245/m.80942 type:complete len:86 (+) Transcript_59245:471-728(+)